MYNYCADVQLRIYSVSK